MDLTRRRLLVSGSTAALALSAGCVADGSDPAAGGDDGGDENGTDDGNESADANGESDGADQEDNETDGSDGEPGEGNETDESGTVNEEEKGEGESRDDDAGEYAIVDRETVQFSGSGETSAEALYSTAAVEDALDDRRLPEDAREEVDALVEETDFDRSIVLLLGAQAPNLCYGIELRDLAVDEGDLTARAAAVDESEPDEGCAQAIHTPTLLVRVTFEDAVPQSGSISVTDGWGNGHASGYGRGSDSARSGR